MSDRQYLLLILGFLAFTECLFWVRRGGVVFRQMATRRWRAVLRSEAIGNERGDLHWCWPLPPAGRVYITRSWPFAAAPDGIVAAPVDCLHPSGQPGGPTVFFGWDAISEVVADGKRLRVNGQELFRSDSPYEPLFFAALLQELSRLPAPVRVEHLRDVLRQSFDREALQEVLADFSERTAGWVTTCTGLWGFLVIACPAIIWRFGWLPALWWLAPALLLQMAWITVGFVRLHRRFFPAANDDRFKLALVYALAPVSASRAPDSLSRPLLGSFHPLCVAAGLLSSAELAPLAESVWRELRYPRSATPESRTAQGLAVEVWFRSEIKSRVESLLREVNLDTAVWERSPVPTDPTHACYCPRCLSQFTQEATTCTDCGRLPLSPIVLSVP
ncbi:MAG: hypothetical protein EXS36_05715 [Pedosphaera sp.]|nr:hypothetical protein [Pedosphaera sp.]